jgi:hypothetical protein
MEDARRGANHADLCAFDDILYYFKSKETHTISRLDKRLTRWIVRRGLLLLLGMCAFGHLSASPLRAGA